MVRNYLSQNDLTQSEVAELFEATARMKTSGREASLAGRALVMFFEKASTRTRLSFEIGMTQLGGHAVYLDRESSQLSRGESLSDTAKVVSRYADLMMARVFTHRTVTELADAATIPVINGLSDEEHPCQSLTDFFTMLEARGHLAGLRIAYVGDGNNNVTHSLLLGAPRLGAHMCVAAPPSMQPDSRFVELAEGNARAGGGSVRITSDPAEAVDNADVVYTDVWVSMGREEQESARIAALAPYQVNDDLVKYARPDFAFMHCLPAHVGQEVASSVAYGPHSIIFDQAENRLHVQKALMVYLLQEDGEDAA